MELKNKIILVITVLLLILAINVHKMRRNFANFATAQTAFVEAGVSAEKYMAGIDFDKPVRIYKVKKGDIFIQFQIPGAPQGNFYGLEGSLPTELGINENGLDAAGRVIRKEMRIYVATRDFDVLSSFAAPVKDDWSTPEDESRTEGKKQQFFTTCKPCFERKQSRKEKNENYSYC